MVEVKGEKYYTTNEAAGALNKNEKTIRRMIADGRLKANTSGKPYLISETVIKAFLDGERQE